MGKEGRRFLPNLKKLGSPRLNFDESYIVSYVQKNIVNSHSMCLFKLENGKFQSISTEGLKKEFNSVDEWLKSYDDWLGGYIKVIFLYGKDLKYIEKEKI